MDWCHLFFTFSGRINRAKFWLAVLICSPSFISCSASIG